MALLEDLIIISNHSSTPEPIILDKMDSFLRSRFLQTNLSLDPNQEEIYSPTTKTSLLKEFETIYNELKLATARSGALNTLPNLAEDFRSKCSNLLRENNIANDLFQAPIEEPIEKKRKQSSSTDDIPLPAPHHLEKKQRHRTAIENEPLSPLDRAIRNTLFHKNTNTAIGQITGLPVDITNLITELGFPLPAKDNILLAAQKFDEWMKTSNVNTKGVHEHLDHFKNHNKALLNFLGNHSEKGFNYIKNYDEFCILAKALQDRDYNTDPPPTLSEFALETCLALSRNKKYRGGNPVMTTQMSLLVAMQFFKTYVNNYVIALENKTINDISNKHLLDYLSMRQGFSYIENYNQLCEFAILLQETGYESITNFPCTPLEFAIHFEKTNPVAWEVNKPPLPTDSALLLVPIRFREWMENKELENKHQTSNHFEDHEQAFKDFINETESKYVENHDALCLIAEALKNNGFNITKPSALAESSNSSSPQESADIIDPTLASLAEKFDTWMQSKDKKIDLKDEEEISFLFDADNTVVTKPEDKALLIFLFKNLESIADELKSMPIVQFQQICDLSSLIKTKGYNTSIPPCELYTFDKLLTKIEDIVDKKQSKIRFMY